MTAEELLAARGIDRALIIDDGYDETPTAADLSHETDAWANFIADIVVDHDVIEAAFPGYQGVPTDDLIANDTFVRALWGLEGRLTGTAWGDLFGRYQRDQASDRGFLTRLEQALQQLNVTAIPVGRDAEIPDPAAPLIFVDLFLGGAQDGTAISHSVRRVLQVLEGREQNPPLVVLMSRSDRLDLNKEEFRHQTKLLGAMFRVSGKVALLTGDTLPRVLMRLAQHQPDGRKLATFLDVWDRGLGEAKERFLETVRRLDLSDYAQIRDLLLDFEGQPLGSYLLDVFDRVLQHEIEADEQTIAAAIDVNDVDLRAYLAPHIAGSSDLQELVHRSIYQHPKRLAVPATVAGAPLCFGDLLAARADIDGGGDLAGHQVLAVMTPACDLVRADCKQVLLMAGTLKALSPEQWSYAAGGPRTPIIIFSNNRRYWVAWDLKNLCTWTPAEFAQQLRPAGTWQPHLRLREGTALELQQRMLADLGRVGQMANMPATFPVSVELLRVQANGEWVAEPLEILGRDGGVCFVGRDADSKPNLRLVISEAACDEITACIAGLSNDQVPENARAALARLKAADDVFAKLEIGLDVTAAKATFSALKTRRVEADKVVEESVAHIARDPMTQPNAQARRSGVVAFVFRDLSQPATPDAPPGPVAAEPIGDEAAAAVPEGVVQPAPNA